MYCPRNGGPHGQKLQTQGVHHITLVGADRQTSVDFWEGVLGMPLVFEQPNLDDPETNHLYFDPGDGRLITVFTREDSKPASRPNPMGIGNLHHLAFMVSRATYTQAKKRLDEGGFHNSGEVDRGFMYSIYFRDPLGQLLELAATSSSRPPATPMPTCCARRTTSASPKAPTTSPTSTWPMPSSCCRASLHRPRRSTKSLELFRP